MNTMSNNALETAIHNAMLSEGSEKEANKAYLEFIKANLIIPVEKESTNESPEVLYLQHESDIFLPVFTQESYLTAWASDAFSAMKLLHLTGAELLKGIGDGVSVSLNIGTKTYKEFNPSEISRMKTIVLKLFNLKKPAGNGH